jgi:hypothetical protein
MQIELKEAVEFCIRRIKRGYSRERILRELKGYVKAGPSILDSKDIFEIAKNRIRAKKKFGELANLLFFDDDGLRYSTPPPVAEYRAKRLKAASIADVSCGVGAQLIYFSKESGRATGVELNEKRAFLARLNLNAMNLEAEIIVGDALSDEVVKKIDAEVVFSDPSRPPEESVRSLKNLEPPPERVIEKYSRLTERIAFELPPQLPPGRIKLRGEREYTSLNFRLNRLALYRNDLAECRVSAITIPSLERVTDEDETLEPGRNGSGDFLHEVDFTVIKAGLLPNLLGKMAMEANIIIDDGKRVILTSNSFCDSAFVRNYYIEEICSFNSNEISKELKELKAGKVTLRFSIPSSEYWTVRKKLEDGLSGEEHFHLFKKGDRAFIARLL